MRDLIDVANQNEIVDIYVDDGSFNSPYYRFYSDFEISGSIIYPNATTKDYQLTYRLDNPILYLDNSYIFHRIKNVNSHPFYITTDLINKSEKNGIKLEGDGSYTSGIIYDNSFSLTFNGITDISSIYYFCTSHSSRMNGKFILKNSSSINSLRISNKEWTIIGEVNNYTDILQISGDLLWIDVSNFFIEVVYVTFGNPNCSRFTKI